MQWRWKFALDYSIIALYNDNVSLPSHKKMRKLHKITRNHINFPQMTKKKDKRLQNLCDDAILSLGCSQWRVGVVNHCVGIS